MQLWRKWYFFEQKDTYIRVHINRESAGRADRLLKPDADTNNATEQQSTESGEAATQHRIRLFGKHLPLPQSVWLRRILGGGLIVGGVFSFLPVLGVWMLPLGLIILSRDSSRIRRIRRKSEVGLLRRWREYRARKKAEKAEQQE